jgi:tRNA(Ile)-lysidine synthase
MVAFEKQTGARVVVAVSGGGDSVGLLRLLHEARERLDLRLSVAHLDHGTRDGQSRADADFVEDLAARLDLPCDRKIWQATRAGHFEADARRARYAWFREVAQARGASLVAVGHTRDDQAETILHRVVRGTGLRGLAGIPARRPLAPGVELIRPLLDVNRWEIRTYLAEIGQEFREDPTNTDIRQTRARIRHDLLPQLAQNYNPDTAGALIRLGEQAREASRIVERLAWKIFRKVLIEKDLNQVILDRQRLTRYDPFDRAEVLRLAWRGQAWPEAAMDATRWRRLAEFVGREEGRIAIGAGVEAVASIDRLVLQKSQASYPAPQAVPLPIPGSAVWENWVVEAVLEPDADRQEIVDLDRVVPPLEVSGVREGDRFEPLGMAGKHQSLGEFFRGQGVARFERSRVPLVCDASGVIWVVGHRIADRVRRTEATTRTLGLRFARNGDEVG